MYRCVCIHQIYVWVSIEGCLYCYETKCFENAFRYVYICIYMYICICVEGTNICIYTYMCICVESMNICIYTYICICVEGCLYQYETKCFENVFRYIYICIHQIYVWIRIEGLYQYEIKCFENAFRYV
jgi:hypothetical protein